MKKWTTENEEQLHQLKRLDMPCDELLLKTYDELERCRFERANLEESLAVVGERTFDYYAGRAVSTAIYPGAGTFGGLTYAALGLNGEAGELAEHVKKAMRDDGAVLTPERRVKLVAELGDVLWYAAAVARELDVSLAEVARLNISKLDARKREGKLGGSGSDR